MTINILITLFVLGWILVLTLVIGETHAINNPASRFTAWWRKHVIGIENKQK